MEWHKLTKKTMPPEGESILLWLDYSHEGFPVCGVYDCGGITYASNWCGIKSLDKSCWRDTRWALIETPEGAVV